MKNRLLCALLIMLLLTSTGIVFGQDTDDSAARAIVQQAIDRLEDGYRFSTEHITVLRYLGENPVMNGYYSEQHIEGQIAANGDYDAHIAQKLGATAESTIDIPQFISDVLSYDGAEYINVLTAGTAYEASLPDVESGWHNRDDLLSALGDSLEKKVVDYSTTFERLKDIPDVDKVLSVLEQEPETIDAVDLRVFVFTIDPLAVLDFQSDVIEIEPTCSNLWKKQRERL